MARMDPKVPIRADHRFIKRVIETMDMKKRVVLVPSELSRASRVFCKAGGSWERVFHGSVRDTLLLKKVLTVAFKKGYLTRKEKWLG